MSQKELDGVVDALKSIANSIVPLSALPGQDATGGAVCSLTEAAMGIAAGLVRCAESLESIAAAIRDSKAK